jgi:Lon protease-like protein
VEEIGLFPLGIVLLPTEQVPLHIFEPRYRELVEECLRDGTEFGLVLADDDGVREVGTRAAVAHVANRFADGTLDIVVEGGRRFRLVEITSGRSFQTGLVEDVADRDSPTAGEDAERALDAFRRMLELAGADEEPPDASHPELSFALAGRFELSLPVKQALLQRTSERERLTMVIEILERAEEATTRQRELQELAQRNGHVRPGT